jgi:hypothetical protein
MNVAQIRIAELSFEHLNQDRSQSIPRGPSILEFENRSKTNSGLVLPERPTLMCKSPLFPIPGKRECGMKRGLRRNVT